MIIDQEVSKLGAAAVTDQESEEDLYLKMKSLEKQLEILEIQEDAIKEELRNFQSEEIRMKEAVSITTLIILYKPSPLIVGWLPLAHRLSMNLLILTLLSSFEYS